MPNHGEHYGNMEWVKLKIHCDRNDIKLIIYGIANYLPFYSLLSDHIILQHSPQSMARLFCSGSVVGANSEFLGIIAPNAEFQDIRINRKIIAKDRRDRVQGKLMVEALKSVSNEDVAQYLLKRIVCVREASCDKFCEIRNLLPRKTLLIHARSYKDDTLRRHEAMAVYISQNSVVPTTTKHESDDQQHYAKRYHEWWVQLAGEHYLTTQIFAASENKCFHVGIGGAANLFCMLPVNSVFLQCGTACHPDSLAYHIVPMISEELLGKEFRDIPIIPSVAPNILISESFKRMKTIVNRMDEYIQFSMAQPSTLLRRV